MLVVSTSFYLKWLNVSHAKRRVALGKKADIVDMSLETAAEVGRRSALDRVIQEGSRAAEGGSEYDFEADNNHFSEEFPVQANDHNSFADLTDLENEDFVFVY